MIDTPDPPETGGTPSEPVEPSPSREAPAINIGAMRTKTSSARLRKLEQSSAFRLAMLLGLVLAILLVAQLCRKEEPTIDPLPAPVPTPQPTRTPTPSPTPGLVEGGSGWVDADVILPPTPTLFVPTVAAPPPRRPRPTPSISQCAAISFTTLQVFSPSAQVKVDIRVGNRCPYDLGPGNLWFDITGWRDGGRVQSMRGHAFETIRRGSSGDVSIGLPGSLDWYDQIEVVVLD